MDSPASRIRLLTCMKTDTPEKPTIRVQDRNAPKVPSCMAEMPEEISKIPIKKPSKRVCLAKKAPKGSVINPTVTAKNSTNPAIFTICTVASAMAEEKSLNEQLGIFAATRVPLSFTSLFFGRL